MLSLIVAHDTKFGIGKNNNLPWRLTHEIQNFKKITTGSRINNKINAVIMGRKTWESIPNKFKPLPNRINIILTKQENFLQDKLYTDTFACSSIDTAIDYINDYSSKILNKTINEIFIIGGSSLYQEAINRTDLINLYITEVYHDFECDTFFPSRKVYQANYNLLTCSNFVKENDIHYRYYKYQKNDYDLESQNPYKNLEEQQYLDILYKIGLQGIKRGDRTGTGTISVFGETQKFDLRETFPILTTKRIFFKAVFEELMLYLRGQTDNKILNQKNIHIWDGNTSRDFLDSRKLYSYEEGDMGETYGFNFRHYGGDYKGCSHPYIKGKDGFDQLQNVINLIKHNPESRRIIINLWNPYTEHKAALPSCLCWYQFYVNPYQKSLSLLINLRSSDFFLANNWNVCTGALLVHLLCNLPEIDLSPGDLTVISGDTHLYINHLEQVEENLKRRPRPYPKLLVKSKKNIEDYEFEDLTLLGYQPYPNIKADMAV